MELKNALRGNGPVSRRMVLYLPLGYPDWFEFFSVLDVIEEHGIGYIELGIPAKDPFMDGSVIRKVHRMMLPTITPKDLESALVAIRARYSFRVILMTYAEGIEHFHIDRLERWLYDAILCVDRDLTAEDYGGLVHVFAAGMSDDDMDEYLHTSSLFAYIASSGKTGGSMAGSAEFGEVIRRIRTRSQIPAYVGFGIRNGTDVRRVLEAGADGAIIGTELIRQVDAGGARQVDDYLASLKLAAKPPSWGQTASVGERD